MSDQRADWVQDIQRLAGITPIANAPQPTAYSMEGSNISITGQEKADLQHKHNIQPGTPEWFKLWFTRPYLTNTSPLDAKFQK